MNADQATMTDTLVTLLSVSALIIGLAFVWVIGPKKKNPGPYRWSRASLPGHGSIAGMI
jgi:hypothetical protein